MLKEKTFSSLVTYQNKHHGTESLFNAASSVAEFRVKFDLILFYLSKGYSVNKAAKSTSNYLRNKFKIEIKYFNLVNFYNRYMKELLVPYKEDGYKMLNLKLAPKREIVHRDYGLPSGVTIDNLVNERMKDMTLKKISTILADTPLQLEKKVVNASVDSVMRAMLDLSDKDKDKILDFFTP